MLPRASADYYRSQQRLTVATLAAMRRVWERMGADFDAAWPTVGPQLVALLAAAQLGVATASVDYMSEVLAETGQDDDPVAEVAPRAFAGTASDGFPLDSLLYGAVIAAKLASRGGAAAPAEALARGRRWLDMTVRTQVADTGRAVTQVGIATRPRITGYVRMLNLPSCSRCVILAGKWYGWNTGFRRHPACDCRHIPASEDMAGDLRTDPRAALRSGRVTGLSRTDRQALDDGADLNQVVNARRRRAGDGMSTSEGTSRRGYASYVQREAARQRGEIAREVRAGGRRRVQGRLTPDAIYRVAQDRTEAVRLLHANGYIVGDIAAVAARGL